MSALLTLCAPFVHEHGSLVGSGMEACYNSWCVTLLICPCDWIGRDLISIFVKYKLSCVSDRDECSEIGSGEPVPNICRGKLMGYHTPDMDVKFVL